MDRGWRGVAAGASVGFVVANCGLAVLAAAVGDRLTACFSLAWATLFALGLLVLRGPD